MELAFKKLDVWKRAVTYAVKVIDVVESVDTGRKHYRLIEQIEACSTSIAMNIAEGKGRYSKKEFKHYLFISRGSLYETLTLLEIFYQKGWISEKVHKPLEQEGTEIAAMIKGLINSIGN